jgi:hypothetical protein
MSQSGTTQEQDSSTSGKPLVNGRILDDAFKLINGDRQSSYGSPKECHDRVAILWSVYLKKQITAADVCMLMALLKIGREVNKPNRDNALDACGYLGIYHDLIEEENE